MYELKLMYCVTNSINSLLSINVPHLMLLHSQVDDWIASYERLWHFVGRFIGGDTSVVTFSGPGSPPPRRQRIRRFFELNAGIIAACYQREDLCTLLDFTQPGVEDSFVRCVR